MITCLLNPESLAGDRAEITGETYRHLFRARRLAAGETLRLVDGLGQARWARVEAVDRRSAVLALGEKASAGAPPLRLELLTAMPRPERAAWLVEKATELGVWAIRWIGGQRAPREIGPGRLKRLGRVAAAALEQSHGSRLPEISGVHPWSEVEALLGRAADRFVLDPKAERGLAESTAASSCGDASARAVDVAVLIGPEGGWAKEELAALEAFGCQRLRLGERVLRIETAALAAASHWLLG